MLSFIIPTYNVEKYIEDCLDSIFGQKINQDYEIILLDDASTDKTVEKIKSYKEKNKFEEIILIENKENKRQGYVRNQGVQMAKGDYIMFMDADDFLKEDSLNEILESIDQETDFCVFDWEYYKENKGFFRSGKDSFMKKKELKENETEMLLNTFTYFTVNKIYRKDFLIKNNIKYGEGYYYEDFEFYAEVSNKAKKVMIFDKKIYKVRLNEFSTTKTNYDNDAHSESIKKAAKATMEKFNPKSEYGQYYLNRYILRKTLYYFEKRIPHKYQKDCLESILKELNKNGNLYNVPKNISKLDKLLFEKKIVQNEKIKLITFLNYFKKTLGKLK